MLTIPKPTVIETGDALIDAIKTEYELDDDSLLKTILAGYGATLNLTASAVDKDGGEYKALKFGDRSTVPDGYSILVIPMTEMAAFEYAPNGARSDYLFQILSIWKNTPTVRLTDSPGKLQRMLTTANEALKVILGPANLGAGSGNWDVTGDEDIIKNPWVKSADYIGQAMMETMDKRHELVYYSRLWWGGWLNYSEG